MTPLKAAIESLVHSIVTDPKLTEWYKDDKEVLKQIVKQWAEANFEEFSVSTESTPGYETMPKYDEHVLYEQSRRLFDAAYNQFATVTTEPTIWNSRTFASYYNDTTGLSSSNFCGKRTTSRLFVLRNQPRLTKAK